MARKSRLYQAQLTILFRMMQKDIILGSTGKNTQHYASAMRLVCNAIPSAIHTI